MTVVDRPKMSVTLTEIVTESRPVKARSRHVYRSVFSPTSLGESQVDVRGTGKEGTR